MLAKSQEQFESLYREHQNLVYNYLYWRLRDTSEAEDATVETFLRAWKALRSQEFAGSERAYILVIAKNVCVRRASQIARLRAKSQCIHDDLPSHTDLERSSILKQLVQQMLSLLPEEQRDAVWLYYGMKLSVPEIADVLKASKPKIQSWIWRTAVRLRRDYGDCIAD